LPRVLSMLLSVTFSDRIHGFQSSNHTEFRLVAVNGNRGRKAKHKLGSEECLQEKARCLLQYSSMMSLSSRHYIFMLMPATCSRRGPFLPYDALVGQLGLLGPSQLRPRVLRSFFRLLCRTQNSRRSGRNTPPPLRAKPVPDGGAGKLLPKKLQVFPSS